MSMREKIAESIWQAEWKRAGNGGKRRVLWTENNEETMDSYRFLADAVLDALMEPTEGMITEGFAVNSDDIGHPERAKRGQVRVFRAMIQAARDGK